MAVTPSQTTSQALNPRTVYIEQRDCKIKTLRQELDLAAAPFKAMAVVIRNGHQEKRVIDFHSVQVEPKGSGFQLFVLTKSPKDKDPKRIPGSPITLGGGNRISFSEDRTAPPLTTKLIAGSINKAKDGSLQIPDASKTNASTVLDALRTGDFSDKGVIIRIEDPVSQIAPSPGSAKPSDPVRLIYLERLGLPGEVFERNIMLKNPSSKGGIETISLDIPGRTITIQKGDQAKFEATKAQMAREAAEAAAKRLTELRNIAVVSPSPMNITQYFDLRDALQARNWLGNSADPVRIVGPDFDRVHSIKDISNYYGQELHIYTNTSPREPLRFKSGIVTFSQPDQAINPTT